MPYYLKNRKLTGTPKNMTQPLTAETTHRLTLVQWIICAMAAVGFAFDTYALLVLPLIVRPVRMSSAARFWPMSAASAVQATGG